jgi:NADH dehydrogenase
MILVTGATGLVGGELLGLLLAGGHEVRALVREPRRLGPSRVRVQIALGDLAELGDAHLAKQALRGVDTVIHLAAAIRDEPKGTVGEINGLATIRLLRAAERAGVERFVFFSALNATTFQRTRFFRAKALAEQAVLESPLDTTVFAPSIVYGPDDRWIKLQRRLALLPVLPVAGPARARFQPIAAADVARCVVNALDGEGAGDGGPQRHELAGPQTMSYEEIARLIARTAGRERPVLHVPLPFVRRGLLTLRGLVGPPVFATWEEAELMEVSMTTPRGSEDARRLGVEPRPMAEVLTR